MNQFPLPAESLISASIFTLTTAITCELRVRQRRLTDYLNAAEEQFFMVDKARITPLAAASSLARTAPYAQLNRDSVVFAIPYSGEATDEEDQKRLVMVQKLPHQVTLNAPPFSLQGVIHLLKETSLRDALLFMRQQFVPITSAEAVYLPTGQRFSGSIMIVNRMRIEAVFPSSVSAASPGGMPGVTEV
jgi:hypothetical protein